MSLFCCYDWWSANCDGKLDDKLRNRQDEELDFHARSLLVVDLMKDGLQIILVGSHSGKIWAFKPTSSSSPQDLLFEYNFGKPVLDLGSGSLLIGEQGKQLVVLHPTSVNIFSFHESTGSAAHGQQFYLEPNYSITFQFVAYSIVIGSFGFGGMKHDEKPDKERNLRSRAVQDSICVQSMDGSLYFYVNDLNFPCVPGKYVRKESTSVKQERGISEVRDGNGGKEVARGLKEKTEKELQAKQKGTQIFNNYESLIQISKPKFTFAKFQDTYLPTLLCYVPLEDCFVMFSGSWTINCYRYNSLELQQVGPRKRKPIIPEWSFVLGEPIFSLSYTDGYIVALGTRGTLIVLNQNGVACFCKKLSFCPSAYCSYAIDGKLMLLIASEDGTLMVYNGGPISSNLSETQLYPLSSAKSIYHGRLVWSAKLPFTPIAMARGRFEGLSGIIIILSDQGYLQCCYLGTTPKNFMEIPISRESSVEEEDTSLSKVQENNAAVGLNSLTSSKDGRELSLELIINYAELIPKDVHSSSMIKTEDMRRTSSCASSAEVNYTILITPHVPLRNLCVSVSVNQPFQASVGIKFIENLCKMSHIKKNIYYC